MKNNVFFMRHPEPHRLIQDAVKNRYAGGITAVAHVMEMSEVVLANKLNPHYEQNKITLDEFAELLVITHDYRALQSLARLVDMTLIPIEEKTDDVVSGFVQLVSQCGEVAHSIQEGIDENSPLGVDLSRKEKLAILDSLDALIRIALALSNSMGDK